MLHLATQRDRMIEAHLVRRGISNRRVLDAFRAVPREDFLPEELAELAYADAPLPIGEDQTISQPYIVALTAEALELCGRERVLEVGTGSGYAAAILSRLGREVFTIERFRSLADAARDRLARLGFANVHVVHGDGSLGLPLRAPFSAIAVAAASRRPPAALLAQLGIGGRLVIPIGSEDTGQELLRITRLGDAEYRQEPLGKVRFVRLIEDQA